MTACIARIAASRGNYKRLICIASRKGGSTLLHGYPESRRLGLECLGTLEILLSLNLVTDGASETFDDGIRSGIQTFLNGIVDDIAKSDIGNLNRADGSRPDWIHTHAKRRLIEVHNLRAHRRRFPGNACNDGPDKSNRVGDIDRKSIHSGARQSILALHIEGSRKIADARLHGKINNNLGKSTPLKLSFLIGLGKCQCLQALNIPNHCRGACRVAGAVGARIGKFNGT